MPRGPGRAERQRGQLTEHHHRLGRCYEIFLPGGTYTLSAETVLQENGLDVDYRTTTSVSLTDATTKGVYLQRVAEQKVSVNWDATLKVTLNAGETRHLHTSAS
jgi:hypothetical protein